MDLNDHTPHRDENAGDSVSPTDLITLVDQPPKDRANLFWTTVACAIGVAAILVSYGVGAWQQWSDGIVEVAVQQVDGVSVEQPAGGTTLTPSGTLEATVEAGSLPAGAVAFLRVADGLQALLGCALVVLLGLFARSIAAGRLFYAQTLHLLNWFTVGVFALAIVPYGLRHMGTNWVISAVGWGASDAPAPDTGSPLWIAYFAALFCLCMQIALRSGGRLARDHDGTV